MAPPVFDGAGGLVQATVDGVTHLNELVRFDAAGVATWTLPLSAQAVKVVLAGPGKLVYASVDGLVALDAMTGAELWRTTLPLEPTDLAGDGAGGVAVLGGDLAGCQAMAVRRYDAAGVFLWSRLIRASGSCMGAPVGAGIAIATDGDVVVVGGLSAPTDLGTGEFQPRTGAGFILDLAR